MFRNSNNSTPFIILIAAAAVLALVGFVSGLRDLNNRQQAAPAEAAAVEPVSDAAADPQADGRPYSPPLAAPDDTRTLVLSGEMGNGGYWRWDEIVNLLGVYGTAGQYHSVTVSGTSYSGVPLAYLLRYARVNAEADRLVLRTREGREHTYAMGSADDFQNYIITAAPNNTLTIVPPSGLELSLVHNLMSIRAEVTEERRFGATPAIAIPASPSSLVLRGSFARGGEWTWADLTNLLGVYGTAGAYTTVNTAQGSFTGVPVSYLMDYAQLTRERANLILLYTRSGAETQTSSAFVRCTSCIIARSDTGTLTLVRPGESPEILPELAVIHIP